MKTKSNLIFSILGIFVIGNICLFCSYIFIYFVAGQNIYVNEIKALTNLKTLLSQIFISGFVSLAFHLFIQMIIKTILHTSKEDSSLKNIIQTCIKALLKVLIYALIFCLIFNLLLGQADLSENLSIGYILFLTLAMCLVIISHITIKSTHDLNTRLKNRKYDQLNNK